LVLAVFAVVLGGGLHSVAADSASSAHYTVDQTQFNAGSDTGCSTIYCAHASAGDTVVGDANSANYSVKFGPNPDNDPLLQVIMIGATSNLGVLDTDRTATATNVIMVRDYASKGYTMQIAGEPPTQGRHALNALTTPTTSHPGAEQFGINLALNTAPKLGADPVYSPDDSTSRGQAAPDYSVPNLFKYVNGDIIAQSTGSDGETDYTMSLIINVSNTTPLGHYGGLFSVVVVPSY
jgi:hypothetical protein